MTLNNDSVRKYISRDSFSNENLDEILGSVDAETQASRLVELALDGNGVEAIHDAALSRLNSPNTILRCAAIVAIEYLLVRKCLFRPTITVTRIMALIDDADPSVQGNAGEFLDQLCTYICRNELPDELECISDEREVLGRLVALGKMVREPLGAQLLFRHIDRFLSDNHFAVRGAALNLAAHFLGERFNVENDRIMALISRARQDSNWWVQEKATLISDTAELFGNS